MPAVPTLTEYYAKFGLSPTATRDDVHTAYRALVKQYHPDLYPTIADKRRATEKLQEFNEAYAAISRHQRNGADSVSRPDTLHQPTEHDGFPAQVKVIRRMSHRRLKRAISAWMSCVCAVVVLYLGIRHLRHALELDLVDSLTYTILISCALAVILATLLTPDPQR